MGSHPRAAIVLALVLLLLGASSAQTPSFCTILNAFISSPTLPDGFVGSDLTDVSFVAKNCAGSTMSFDTTSPTTVTATFLPAGLSLKDATIKRTVSASITADEMVTFEVSLTLSANVVGTYLGAPLSTAIVATMTQSAAAIPSAAAGSFPSAWVGTLATPTPTKLSFQDADLFDEVNPAILTVSDAAVSPSLLKTSEFVSTLAADFNINLGGLTISHPSLVYRSVRGAFIGGVNIIDAEAARSGTVSGATEAGILVQQTVSCADSFCPETMGPVLKAVVDEAALTLCEEDSMSAIMLRSTRVIDMFVTPSNVAFRSASATTEALYQCGDNGFVGLQLRVTNSWQPWPVVAFMEDNTTAAYLAKSNSPWLGGYMWGSLKGENGTSYSFGRSDIFGIHGGGRLMLDVPLVKTAVGPFITQLHDHLNTEVAVADAAIDAADADWSKTLDSYVASSINPTWNGFLQYYTDKYPGFFKITFGPAAKCPGSPLPCRATSPVMDFALTMPAVAIPKADPYMKTFDKVIAAFVAQINAQYSTSVSPASVANSTGASASLFVSYIHRVRIAGNPAPTGTFKANTTIVSDDLVPQLFTAASLVATYPATVGLFGALNVTLVNSTSGSNATLVRARINAPLSSSIGSMLSWDSNNKLVSDLRVAPLSSFQEPLSKAAGQLGNLEFFYTIAPLSLNPSAVGNTTYMQLITSIYAALPALQSVSSQTAAVTLEQLANSAVGSSASSFFAARVSVQSASSMEIDMRYSTLQMITVKSSQLLGRVDVSELLIPTVVQTRLLIQMKTDGSEPTVVFELKAAANYSDFTLPISFSMNSAVTTSSSVGISLALPDGASYMNMQLTAKTDLNATVRLEFETEKLGDQSSFPSFKIYGEEQVQSDPARVFGDIQNLFLLPEANLGGALNATFYPWGDSFSQHMDYADIINKQLPWLLGPVFTPSSPAQSGEICLADIPTSLTGNFTVNAHPAAVCTMALSTASYQSVVDSMNAGLRACGLSTYLMASSASVGSEGCVRLGLVPTTPGVLYQFAIESNLWNSTWTLMPFVEFTSWPELPIAVTAVLPQATVSPVRIFTAPSSAFPDLVDTNLRPVFPKLTVAEYSVSIAYDTEVSGVNTATTATTADAFYMDLANGVGEGSIAMTFGAKVRSVMDLPVVASCVSTNFSDSSIDMTSTAVPAAPANVLSLSVVAFIRSPGNVELVTWEGQLTLTPDEALVTALENAVAEQPAGTWLAGLLNATRFPGDALLGIPDQVRVCINQRQLEGDADTWVIPLEIAVINDDSPFFATQSLVSPNSINMAVANFSLSASLDATAEATNTTVGVVQFSTYTPVTGTSTIDLSVNSGPGFKGIGKLSSAAGRGNTLVETYNVRVDTALSWSVKDIALLVDNDGVGTSEATLAINQVRKMINSTEVLNQVADISLRPTYSNPAVARLAKMPANPFCDGISTVLRLSEAVADTDIASMDWPFMRFSAAPLFGQTIKAMAGTLASRVCKTKGLTIPSFCSLIQDAAGFQMCAGSSVDFTALVVLLQFEATPVATRAPFVYDFEAFGHDLNGNATKAIGMDANFDLLASPKGTIELFMDLIDDSTPRPEFILGDNTGFELTVETDFGGDLSARLGPARVSFTGASGGLDLTMSVDLTGSFQRRGPAVAGTRVVFVTEEPMPNRKLAVRQDEPGLQAEITLTGSAEFSATMMKGMKQYCNINTYVPDLAAFFDQGISEDATSCEAAGGGSGGEDGGDGGVGGAIDDAVDSTSPLEFWSDIGMIQNVFIGTLRDFVMRILGPKLGGLIFPLIEDIATYLMEPVMNVISPQHMNAMSSEWQGTITKVRRSPMKGAGKTVKPAGGMTGTGMTGMTGMTMNKRDSILAPRQAKTAKTAGMGMSKVAKSGMTGMKVAKTAGMTMSGMGMGMGQSTSSQINEFLRGLLPYLFTKLLCRVFGDYLRYCPPVPDTNAAVKSWLLPFYYEKVIPIVHTRFALGDHGWADLRFDCSINLVLSGAFDLELTYSEADGLDLKFPSEDVLEVEAKFVTVPGCELAGKLLVVGFQFQPTGVFGAKLTVKKGFKVDVSILASLMGGADIGFAGPIAKAITGDPDAITALPHVHAFISLSWSWSISKPALTTPTFQFEDPQLCLGTLLNRIVGGLAKQVKKIIDPLAPIIGPDGILLRKIAVAKYIIGRETNLLEILSWVAEYFCSIDECTMAGVVDAIKVAAEVYRYADALASMADLDPNGCGVVQLIQNFNLDFLKPTPYPEWQLGEPTIQDRQDGRSVRQAKGKRGKGGKGGGDIVFQNPKMQEKMSEFYDHFDAVTKGDFAFNLDIMEEPITKLITVLLGGRVPVCSFTLPSFTISVGASWSFLVWVWPPIYIVIGLSAGITVDIGKIALLSDGIINAISTGNVGQLVSGLAMPTKKPNGQPHYPLKAFLKIAAGAEVSIFIFTAGVQVWLKIEGAMGFSSVNGDGWITFAEIWNLIKFNNYNIIAAFDKELTVTAGVYLYIQACIPLVFKKICWTIIDLDLKWTLWKETWKGNKPPPIADAGGRVQLGGVKKRKARDAILPQVELNPNSATGGRATAYSNDPLSTFPPIDRNTPTNPVAFDGAAEGEFNLYLHGVTEPVVAPSGQPFVMQMDTRSYNMPTHDIKPTFVSPAISIQDCSLLNYDTLPPLTTVVYTDGAPCQSVHNSVSSASFVVKGTPDGYSGKPITVKDAAMGVDFNVPTTVVRIASNKIFGAPDVNVNIPPPVPFLTITGHPADPTTYTILDSAEGSLLRLTGGTGSDTFITRLSDNKGTVTIDGAGQGMYANWMKFTVDADAGNNVTLSPFVSTQQHMVTNATYTVHHSNTPRRSYNVNAVANEKLYVQVSSMETGGTVDIYTRGAVGAVISHELLSCDDQSELRVYVSGPGQHLVIIGDGSNTLANFGQCTIRVTATSEAGQDARIILNQGEDPVSMEHKFSTNMYAVQGIDTNYLLSVAHTGIDMIVLNAGLAARVQHLNGTFGTETVIHFPDNLTEPGDQENSAVIWAWTNAIIVNGSFSNVTVGRPESPSYSVDPFIDAKAVLAINAQVPDTQVLLVSGQDQNVPAPPQRFMIGNRCFDPLDGTLTKAPKLVTAPTATMLNEMLTYNGFDPSVDYTVCHVAYLGPVHFVVRTGSAPDYFLATTPGAPVNFSFAGGDDISIWSYAEEGAYFNADMGEGRDKLILGLPVMAPINAILGAEMQVDSVDIYPTTMPNPNIATDPLTRIATVASIGPSGETLTLYDYRAPYDLAHIRQGPPGAAITYADLAPRDGVVYINAATPGEVLKVDLQTGQSYELLSCGQDTTVVLDPGSTDPEVPPAANFQITIRLPSYTQSCYILVPAIEASESLINVYYAATPTPNSPNFPASVTEMSAFPGTVWTTFGGTRIQSTYIDHLYLSYPVKVNLTVDGTAGADISISAPQGSWVMSGDSRFAGNALLVGPSLVVSAPAMNSGNLIVTADALSVSIASPGTSATVYDSGAVSFNPPVTPLAVFSPWFNGQLGSAGLSGALSTETNVFISNSAEIIFISPSVTSANTGAAIVPNGLFKVVGGELLLTEAAALTSVAISEIEMTVNTVASELYRVQVDGGHSATVTSSFTETSTLSVQCAGTRLPSRWVFAGTATSSFDFVTSACAGTLVSQPPLPVVSFVQPSSTVVLTSTMPVDAAPFNLAVDVNGDNSAYTMNFIVAGSASPRAHSVALFAANSTLTTSMTVTGVGAVPASTAVLTAASTTATGALSTTFGVVSASALNVSAIGSLSVDSVLLNVTGDILPFDLRLNTLGAPGAKFTYLVSSAAGAAGAVNVSASALINALDMNLGVTGVAVPPAISLVGSINSPGVAISVSGDARMVDINALASATAPSSVTVNYDLFNDVGASLATNLTATTNDQALSIGLTGDKVTGASAVSFGGNMDINTMNLTIVGDISPLAIGMNVTGAASTIGVSVNIMDDSSAPLLLTINGDNSMFDGFFNFTGDQQSGQADSSLLGLSGMVGINSLCVNAVGDFAPLNIDLDLVDAEPSGTFKLYLSDTSAAPVARTNVTFKVDLTTVDAALTMHGLRTGATEMGVVGTMHVTDVNIDVSGDMSSLLNDLHLLSDEATADIEVSIDQDGPRDVNITTTIVTPTPMDLALQLIGQSFGQQITYLGTLGQRNLNVDITGMTNTNIAVSSVDDRLAISADGQSSRRPVDLDILGKILPLTLKLDMSDDNVNLGVASTNNNTVTMQVLVPDPATPGLYWNLMGYNALLDTTFEVLGASGRSPIVNIGGSLTPYEARLKVFGDVSMLSSILQVESTSARFGVDVGVIGADNNRDVNVTVDNLFESSVSLELSVVGSQGSRSQLIGVQGTIGERTLNVALKGATPLLLSLLSREDELNFLANTSRQSRARQSASPDLTVAVSGSILPLDLTVGLENGDDLSMGIASQANHTLMVAVAVPDQTSPGLTYVLAGDNRNISYALSVLKATTRKARFNVDGSLAPIDTILHVYGDIGSINATHHIDTVAPATGLFGLDLGVDGPAAGARNVNVTVTSSEAAETKLDVSLVGQSSQTVSVVGNMDQRKLNVNVNGVTPMLVSFVSRDSDLALNVDSDSYATGRDTLLGVAAEILPMEFTMTVTGDALDLGLVGSSASTSTVNVTLVSDDPARALSSVLFGQNSALDIGVNVAAATSGNPTVAITGGYTTQRSSLNVTGGGVSQLSVDLDVLGDAGVQSAFDLAVAPLAATQRVISVQSQPITADTDGHRFLALDLALISAKTFDLKLVDASNTLLMDTDTVVPTVFVGGTAMMLLNNTDEKSSILFPGRRLVPDWPRDAFRPMLNSRGDDCLQPEPDCTREGWIRTAVTDTATCPNRTCTRTGVILTTPFDVQCPAFGKFPRDEYTILVNPTDAPVKSPYSKWTFYFVVVVLAFCWLVPLAIWTVFGYLYWHLWAEFVICAMILFAQPHTHPLALSMIQNFNYGVSTAFLFNCWDLRNLSILSWTAIAACAVIIALWTIEKLGNPRYKWVIKGAIIGQRFFGGWLFFFVAPIGLANIWTSGVAIGTRLFFALALVAVHVLHRILVRLTRKDKALHPTLLVTIPVAAFAPLVLVGWSFGLGSADVSFAIALACVLIINIPHFIKSWFWKQTGEPQWPWVPAVTIANVIFGLVWVALVYARGPSAAVITFVLLWAVTAVAGTVVGRVMAYLNGKGQRVHSLRHPVENMRSPLLKTDADPSL